MKKIFEILGNRDFLPSVLVFIFALLSVRHLLFERGYFNMHDDLQMMRQLEMEKCFLDGQIPCRWVPDMGYGYGFPLFNFYPPLPYIIGEIFRLFGFSFAESVKFTFALALIASGYAMYFLAKEFFGRIGGVLSAVFYIWAPYHAVDIFVRGAMNESWALVFFPLLYLFSFRLVKSQKSEVTKNVFLLALSYTGLLLSHNLMVMIFTPFLGLWILLHLWREGAWLRLPHLAISGIWALGLAAFFTLPALLENKFTQVTSQLQGYYEYSAHFVSLRQLFLSRFWGYGPSVWMEAEDKMSFQVGHLHWILTVVVGFLLLVRGVKAVIGKKIKKDRLLLATGYVLFIGYLAAYMTHLKSIWIYKIIPPLSYIQFPWRFLTIVIFAFSFVVGFLPGVISDWKSRHGILLKFLMTLPQLLVSFLLSLLLVVLNWNYFRPEGGHMGPLSDEEKFLGVAWELQQTAGIYDYLPIYAKRAPQKPPSFAAELIEGRGAVLESKRGTYWVFFRALIDSDEAKVRINTLYFPGWRVFIKEAGSTKEFPVFVPEEEEWGRMWIKLPKGEYLVYAQFFNTPVRTWANILSFISWTLLLTYPAWKNKVKLTL